MAIGDLLRIGSHSLAKDLRIEEATTTAPPDPAAREEEAGRASRVGELEMLGALLKERVRRQAADDSTELVAKLSEPSGSKGSELAAPTTTTAAWPAPTHDEIIKKAFTDEGKEESAAILRDIYRIQNSYFASTLNAKLEATIEQSAEQSGNTQQAPQNKYDVVVRDAINETITVQTTIDNEQPLTTEPGRLGGPEDLMPRQPAPRVAASVGELRLGVNEPYRDALLLAQRRTGIDAAALAGLINAEAARDRNGRWSPDSYNPDSHARGLTQFIPGTWVGRAQVRGSYLNEIALERGYIREENGRFVIVNREALLALRDDPTASIVTAAEFGRDNLAALDRLGVVPDNISDDERARYMYYAHHEGMAGAVRLLTDSRTATEEEARRALEMNVGRRRAANLSREHGSYAEAFRNWTEARSQYLFPIQVGRGTRGQQIIDRYVRENGDYEHGYRAWLIDHTNRNVRPDRYRRER